MSTAGDLGASTDKNGNVDADAIQQQNDIQSMCCLVKSPFL